MSRLSIQGGRKAKAPAELLAHAVFALCGVTAIAAVLSITVYMIANGLPALAQVGVKEILFSTHWAPTAAEPTYGILYIILTSLVGTAMALVIGVPIGVLAAVFLAELAPRRVVKIMQPIIELLAGIPSVVYGLMGLMILNPLMYRAELALYKNDPAHQFTGGSNLLSAVLVLAIMILPTVISMSQSALEAVPTALKAGSLGVGASRLQTVFRVQLPAAKSGIITAVVLGVGRAIGEAMAISLVSGSAVNFPLPFHSVRFLTTAIVSEMGYAADTHRMVLFTIGLVLFVFIMAINLVLNRLLRRGGRGNE